MVTRKYFLSKSCIYTYKNKKNDIQKKWKTVRNVINIVACFKGTLMQIWKSPYMFAFIWKQYPENFVFLILKVLELFAREFVNFLKSRLIFNVFYCFLNVWKQTFHISHVRISQKVKSVLMWNFQHIVSMRRWRCWLIFNSSLVLL